MMGCVASAMDEFIAGNKLYLDAANPLSYPGTGTAWNDLSGSGNNGTLVNGVGFSGGNMVFDGVNDYVELPSTPVFINTSLPFTISAFVRLTEFSIPFPVVLVLKTNLGCYNFGISNNLSFLGLYFGVGVGTDCYRGRTNTESTFFIGKWVNIIITYNGVDAKISSNFSVYLNNVHTAHTAATSITTQPNTFNRIGIRADSALPFKGSINDVNIYDYALTAQQVSDNFEALRGKYGI